MNKKSIDQARDPLLRDAIHALKRAGKRARKEAENTGTCLIVGDGEKVIRIHPKKALGSQKS
jgi:hypothetical protein